MNVVFYHHLNKMKKLINYLKTIIKITKFNIVISTSLSEIFVNTPKAQ